MKALILAAGMGTRLGVETRHIPKALVEVGKKPLLQHAIEKLKNEGISEITVNVHHFPDLIISFLTKNDFEIPVNISDETNKLLDTGGGLKKAAPLLAGDEPVLIYNADILSDLNLEKLYREHMRSDALATLVVRKRETHRYFKFNPEKRLVGWVNKKTGETKISIPADFEMAQEMAFSGIHILHPDGFRLFPDADRFSLTNWYLNLAKNHLIKGYFDDSPLWMDAGKPGQLQKARKLFAG